MRTRRFLALAAVVLAAACQEANETVAPDAPSFAASPRTPVLPNGQKIGTLIDSVGPRTKNRIEYHSGATIPLTADVYLIWYGNWGGDITRAVLPDLVSNIGSSPYMKTVTQYTNGIGDAPNGAFIYGGSVDDMYSHGPTLTRADVSTIIHNQLASGGLPLDGAGIYVVLATPDVAVSDLDQRTCAFHQPSTFSGATINNVFIIGAIRMPTVCVTQQGGPNGTTNGDAMASLLAAELANTVTDPVLNSYYDKLGYEMADKCAWSFGTTYTAPNGTKANVQLGQRHFLLQQLWLPTKGGGRCTLTAS